VGGEWWVGNLIAKEDGGFKYGREILEGSMNKLIHLTIAIVAFPVLSFANGGPVAWDEGAPTGGVAPINEKGIGLVREELVLSVLDDMNHYTVSATYHLRVDEPKKVKFGVPLNWSTRHKAADTAKGISIVLNGERHPCTVQDVKESPGDIQFAYEVYNEGTAWCVAELPLTQKGEQKLLLEYEGELDYQDMIYTKSALVRFDPRWLRYSLFPAGYWNGNVDRLDIILHPGPYAGRIKSSSLPGYKAVDESSVRWELSNVDLKALHELEVEFDSAPFFEHLQLAEWNKKATENARADVKAKASSTLGKYNAANVTDGDPSTAWCEGEKGDGLNASIDIIVPELREKKYCVVEGFGFVPGYAKTQKSYSENNRVKKVRIESCSDPQVYDDFEVKNLSDIYNLSARMLNVHWEGDFKDKDFVDRQFFKFDGSDNKQGCVRFTILEIEKGSKYDDTCISEIAPVINCN